MDTDKRSSQELCLQEGYTWVPPGLNSEQIYDYMSCLPGHKVPRLATPGEKARERQLMLQLPKQDLALAYTRHVETQYHTSFKDFVAARNDIALDIGIIKPHIPYNIECRGCEGYHYQRLGGSSGTQTREKSRGTQAVSPVPPVMSC
ncbi:prickle planar cell polarity protein 3-like [Homarus americanus]|uniref:prickle planar cell polarity protein 3-like n=1 Tax=Homarus americanus TaxID=6706 RepID=UPI001C4759A3|nr:prickle planar cell polarity protein 3-like [Homarus americanus]